MKKIKFPKIELIIFIVSIIVISLVYRYQKILFYPPQSIHCWRQTDCTSQALNYYQNGMNFFKPEIHNLVSDNGKTGYCVEEFPIIFYSTAILYHIFGFHEWLFRFLDLLIFFLGLFYIYKLFLRMNINILLSLSITLLFFTSPVIVYYANNFIGNVPAFSITIIGWYFFFEFYKSDKINKLLLSIIFFTLSSLLKLSEMISLFTIIGLYLFELMGIFKFGIENKKLFVGKKILILIFFSLSIIIAWYYYANWYNNSHSQKYYIFEFLPIWSLDKNTVSIIWNKIILEWQYDYFHTSILLLFAISFISNIFYIKKSNKLLFSITMFLFFGSIFYSLLWFKNFKEHDYYIITMYIVILFTFLTSLDIIKKINPAFLNYKYFIVLSYLLLIFNVSYSREKIYERYNSSDIGKYIKNQYKDFFTITPYLRSIGIDRSDKIITVPDFTLNYSLYLSNQIGWTEFNGVLIDSTIFENCIKNGAKYLFVNGNYLDNGYQWLNRYKENQVGEYGQVKIYCLTNTCNSQIVKEEKERYYCNLENTNIEGNITDTSGRIVFDQKLRSNEKFLSEKYSVKLCKGMEYGLTTIFEKVQANEEYKITVWRFPKNNKSSIVVCINSPDEYYTNNSYVVESNNEGWEKLSITARVPMGIVNGKMSINLWYQGDSCAYFDNLEIKKIITKYIKTK